MSGPEHEDAWIMSDPSEKLYIGFFNKLAQEFHDIASMEYYKEEDDLGNMVIPDFAMTAAKTIANRIFNDKTY